MTSYRVKLTTTTPMLGTAPADPVIYQSFVIERALKAGRKMEDMTPEEQENLRHAVEDKKADEVAHLTGYNADEDKGMTTLRRDPDNGTLMIPDFMIRGFMKAAAKAVTDAWGVKGSIDRYVFVGAYDAAGLFTADRWIPICRGGSPLNNPELTVERSLRAETMQGDRTALAKSEAVDAGCTMEFRITVLDPAETGNGIGTKAKPVRVKLDVLQKWFNYGQLSGLGQWRNGSFGRFTAEVTEIKVD
jgi:hypothetical protein